MSVFKNGNKSPAVSYKSVLTLDATADCSSVSLKLRNVFLHNCYNILKLSVWFVHCSNNRYVSEIYELNLPSFTDLDKIQTLPTCCVIMILINFIGNQAQIANFVTVTL